MTKIADNITTAKKTKLRTALVFIGILLVMACSFYFGRQYFGENSAGNSSGQVTLPSLYQAKGLAWQIDSNESFAPQNIKNLIENRLVIVHFWAAWCKPCEDELPDLIRFAKHMSGKNIAATKIAVIAVSLDPDWGTAKPLLQGTHTLENWVNVLDANRKLAEEWGAFQYPETYIFNSNGSIKAKWVGAQPWARTEFIMQFINWLNQDK
jgi:thiol-disulfide isomerase/thioredoxin